MSVALNAEKNIQVNSTTYSEPKCKHCHARGAESLANWLRETHLRRQKIFLGVKQGKKSIKGEKGIIFFEDCFTRDGQTHAVGDHIDLWDGEKTIGFQDSRNNSTQVWFWELC